MVCIHIRRINHVNNSLGFLVVSIPRVPKIFLTTQVPHLEAKSVFVDCFHIAADSRLCYYYFVERKLVKKSGFSSVVKSSNYNFDF